MKKTKKPKPKPKKRIKGKVIVVPTKFNGQDPMAFFKPPPRKNVEDDAMEPDDAVAAHKYPPPRKNKVFREKWAMFIDNIISRKNFHLGHLETLRILCDSFAEYEQLKDFLAENGTTYCAVGRNGEQWKMYPHVNQLNRVKETISIYSKMLDLVLKKDEGDGGKTGEDDEWK